MHGFTTRRGGVSAPPFDSLNLGLHVGDDAKVVLANRARLARALRAAPDAFVFAAQVHGAVCGTVGADDRGRGATSTATSIPGADALACADADVLLAILTADCVPILLADPVRRVCAAVHAGWRGTVAGAVGAAVRSMAALGTRPADVRAAIGPAIGADDYAVGAEVREAAAAASPGAAARWLRERDGAMTFDLALANRDQLVDAGVAPDRVAVADVSTAGDAGTWFSHRAQGGRTGRQAAVVGWRGEGATPARLESSAPLRAPSI
ncbi:MAG: peptidoglycan editing factor PgeF [Ardenticatenales bacterium]